MGSGPKLRLFRKKHRLKLQEISFRSGINLSTLSRIESGFLPLKQHHLNDIELAFKSYRVTDTAFFAKLSNQLNARAGPDQERKFFA